MVNIAPQWQLSHNALFCNRNVHTCAHFCYKMVYCGIWNSCMVGFWRWFIDIVYPEYSGLSTRGDTWYRHFLFCFSWRICWHQCLMGHCWHIMFGVLISATFSVARSINTASKTYVATLRTSRIAYLTILIYVSLRMIDYRKTSRGRAEQL